MVTEQAVKRLQDCSGVVADDLAAHLDSSPIGAVLTPANVAGTERFIELGLPHSKHEMFTYVNTGTVNSHRYITAGETLPSPCMDVPPECSGRSIAIINGSYRPEYSDLTGADGQIVARHLGDVVANDRLFAGDLIRSIKNDKDVFSAINSALIKEGVVIDIVENAITEPLFIMSKTGGINEGAVTTPRLSIRAGENSRSTVIIVTDHNQPDIFTDSVFEITVGAKAHMDLYMIQPGKKIKKGEFSQSFTRLKVVQNENSYASFVGASAGSPLLRSSVEWRLTGKGCKVDYKSLSQPAGADVAHLFARFVHTAPECESDIVIRNIVRDSASVSTDSTVIVSRGAFGSVSRQLVNNLMLSGNGRADTKPNLMIFNDDVKCSHGATFGQTDPEQLLYLRSRGLSERRAVSVLTEGFSGVVTDAIKVPSIREMVAS